MAYVGEELYYDLKFKLLVCQLHGNGLHPNNEAIKRHLRGPGHRSRGKALVQVLHAIAQLPLASLDELREAQSANFGTANVCTQPIPYLKIVSGWACALCGGRFLTTSLELVQRHAAAVHGRRRDDPALWEKCQLQTLFSETKDRRYFRVPANYQEEPRCLEVFQEDPQKQQSSQESTGAETGSSSTSPSSDLYQSSPNSSEESVSSPGDLHIPLHVSSLPPSQDPSRSNLQQAIVLRHPFMSVAEKYVPLSGSRINYLLKSPAFRSASMPIFDGSPIDTAVKMQAVFPESEESAVWANALLYSTVQIANRGAPTVEGQMLLEKTIQSMNRKLTSPNETFCSAAVGAIMLLKATAYKTYDLVAHDVHSRGLAKILDYVEKSGFTLTPAARKALFWVDLTAVAFLDSERKMSHLDLPPIRWRREIRPEVANNLPVGFMRHRDAFPYVFPECIADLVEFQEHLREYRAARIPRSQQYVQFDPMQASLESRLVFQALACREVGVLAEAVRLAVYICTYCSFMDTWNDSHLPCRLAMKVYGFLGDESVWDGRIDLIFWLVFVSSSVAELDDGQVEGLKARRDSMLGSVFRRLPYLVSNDQLDIKTALQRALNDFVYVDGWLERRSSIPLWHEFELVVSGNVYGKIGL